ncbi:MAG: EcoRI family type II restriction endonuclease [Candidatus Spyradenecus sp.]
MAKKSQLRQTRKGSVINTISKRQEAALRCAVDSICQRLGTVFPQMKFTWQARAMLSPLVETLRARFPEVNFEDCHRTSFMAPDGGFLSIVGKDGKNYPILISEKKNQGTNDLRLREGKQRQAQGNAIERLGKNVIGLRVMFLHETIFPFVCFGDGCDFDERLSILDRVRTIAMFGSLNTQHLHREGMDFNRGSFYFRVEPWTQAEMETLAYPIAEQSIYYYFSKYGKDFFACRK